MSKNPLFSLHEHGQSVWYDNIRRSIVLGGELQRLIDERAVVGLTSNPTIFEKAIVETSEYDDTIRAAIAQGKTSSEVFEMLTVEDIRNAADKLYPVYKSSNHKDGYVSIEVSPTLANDTEGTLKEARRLASLVGKENLMVKVPATPAGIPAIRTLTSEGININITLIFSLENYIQVTDAYILGLEDRVAAGKDISNIASVASFFVSRVDTLVDKLLDQKISEEKDEVKKSFLKALQGKAAIANARVVYEKFKEIFNSERFTKLAGKGAHVQRPLWASTSTKNPAYRDVLYVEELIGPDTVDTMPPQTIEAFAEHGQIAGNTVEKDVRDAHKLLEELGKNGISYQAVTQQLQDDGVRLFSDSFAKVINAIETKRSVLSNA